MSTAKKKRVSKTAKQLANFLPQPAFLMAKNSKKAGAPPVDASAFSTLKEVYESLDGCKRCKICKGRTSPFVGRSGQLLTKMIEAMGVKREEVFIANVVKCRPPDNRPPKPDEVEQCRPFLEAQIKMLKPKVVVALGKTAAMNLLQTKESIGELRGKIHSYQGTKLIATFHPAYLLRNPPAKKDCWEDLQRAMKELGWKAPAKS